MIEYNYQAYEDISLVEPTEKEFELHFSEVKENKRDKFAYVKGRVLSRGYNKKKLRFTEKALEQAEKEFKPAPYLIEHQPGLDTTLGTITSVQLNDNGLDFFAIIPRSSKNDHYISMMENDPYNTIRSSIGGTTNSITCTLCGDEVMHDKEHRLGEKYEQGLAMGDIQTWTRTKEISATVFPADEDTPKQVYTTGFSELDDLLFNEEAIESEALINENDNTISDLNMTEHDLEKMENEPAQIEVAQTSAPEIDTSQFVSKEDYDALFSLVKELKDGAQAEKDKVLSEKRLKLTELTGEDEAEYISFGEEALDKMIKFASKSRKNVPEELGFVEGGKDKVVKQNVTDAMKKEALRIILNIPETSAKVNKHYGAYKNGRALNVYDRVGKELEAKFSEDEN